MSAVNKHISRQGTGRKILLIGDLSRAFLDVNTAAETPAETCADMRQAIEITARKNFAAIAIVMSGISTKLSSDLKALRDNSDAKIILLAQMYEEPIAIHLVNSAYNGLSLGDTLRRNLADDYLICPVKPDSFYESILDNGYSILDTRREPRISSARSMADKERESRSTETRIRHLERLATEDDLTGLKNRRYIWEFSQQIIEYAKKENGRVTLLVFDVDDLKKYNDTYGHQAGDEILKQAAVLMQRCCRGHDVVGRVGGDEFAVIFWDDPQQHRQVSLMGERADALAKSKERRSAHADHPAEAITIAKRFVKELGKTGLSTFGGLGPKGKGVLTISGGLASFPRDGRTIEQLFQQADKALLEAKRSGKNRIYLVGKPQNDIADID
ncbi:MAG: GGDEF domain-containing protein [Planctomycetota bacterium]|jgi:diguanylate cyclase (GGDEF)-like protein